MNERALHVIAVLFATLLYAMAFHYAYVVYINPVFEYAHYDYYEQSLGLVATTYALLLVPMLLYRDSLAPASHGVALIFALCYVPGQLILLFTWLGDRLELQSIQLSLAGSMAAFVWISRFGGKFDRPIHQGRRLTWIIGVLAVMSLAVLVILNREHMRIVSFAEVYDLRFQAQDVETNSLANYPMMWLSYCFLPFFFAQGITQRNWLYLASGFVGCVLVYAANGAKAAILMPFIAYGLYVLVGSGHRFLLKLLLSLAFGIAAITALLPDDGVFLWIKSILFVRVLGAGGWTMATYYDYFSTHGYTFYTHIGPVNALTEAYPYGEMSLGQLIGMEYSGTMEANFNANFWASDGFAALGLPGVAVVTVAVAMVLYAINRLASGYSSRFVTVWLSSFWLAMLNVPLTTAMLSGGGMLTLLLLWSARRRRRAHRPLVQSAVESHC